MLFHAFVRSNQYYLLDIIHTIQFAGNFSSCSQRRVMAVHVGGVRGINCIFFSSLIYYRYSRNVCFDTVIGFNFILSTDLSTLNFLE